MTAADDVLPKIQAVFAEQLDQDGLKLSLFDSPATISGWDSLAHVRIMAGIEEIMGFQFDIEELEQLCTVAAIIKAVQARI